MSDTSKKLKVVPLAFALGITWGLGLLLAGWLDWWTTNYATQFVNTFASIYIGYGPSFWGGVIGFCWGFVDLFIGGLIIAWIYNCCASKCKHGEQ